MNDTIRDAVAASGISADHQDAAVAYLEGIRSDATQVAVQMYVDRTVRLVMDRGASSGYASTILSAAFGEAGSTMGRDYYGNPQRQFFAEDGSKLAAYDRETLLTRELGSVDQITDDGNTAWSADPFPFRFMEAGTPDPNIDDLEILSGLDDIDEDDEDDEDDDSDY